LIAAGDGSGGLMVVDAFSRIVRLGEGMGEPEDVLTLSEPAIRRTIKALRVCAGKMRRHAVRRARCVATEACRRAANGRGFVRRVERQTGLALEIISGDEEAELAVSGCAPLIAADAEHALFFDIGGGSTELIWAALDGGRARILGTCSLPCGVATLARRFGRDRFAPETFAAMVEAVLARVAPFEAHHRIAHAVAAKRVQMIGTSGTVTTLAGVHLGLARYDRARVDGRDFATADIRDVSLRLAGLDYTGRAAIPCVGRQRADLVVGGCAVVEALCRLWPVETFTVADRGVREGIIHRMIDADGAAA